MPIPQKNLCKIYIYPNDVLPYCIRFHPSHIEYPNNCRRSRHFPQSYPAYEYVDPVNPDPECEYNFPLVTPGLIFFHREIWDIFSFQTKRVFPKQTMLLRDLTFSALAPQFDMSSGERFFRRYVIRAFIAAQEASWKFYSIAVKFFSHWSYVYVSYSFVGSPLWFTWEKSSKFRFFQFGIYRSC